MKISSNKMEFFNEEKDKKLQLILMFQPFTAKTTDGSACMCT